MNLLSQSLFAFGGERKLHTFAASYADILFAHHIFTMTFMYGKQQAFGQMGVLASCGRPLLKQNCLIFSHVAL